MEIVQVQNVHDALAWAYAGAVPSPHLWRYTGSEFGKFRTIALLKKSVDVAKGVHQIHPSLASKQGFEFQFAAQNFDGLPTRMFDQEIWMNLTAPLKHQLDSVAVVCVDDSMASKSVNALRWDGKGWWCAGLDGLGVRMVLQHLGFHPKEHVLGLCGGGGGSRSTAVEWHAAGGRIHVLESRRMLDVEGLEFMESLEMPDIIVDFDDAVELSQFQCPVLKATYTPMKGSVDTRVKHITSPCFDGRWLLVAQHLACWAMLWAPERAEDLPSLPLLLTRLLHAESVLESYTI